MRPLNVDELITTCPAAEAAVEYLILAGYELRAPERIDDDDSTMLHLRRVGGTELREALRGAIQAALDNCTNKEEEQK